MKDDRTLKSHLWLGLGPAPARRKGLILLKVSRNGFLKLRQPMCFLPYNTPYLSAMVKTQPRGSQEATTWMPSLQIWELNQLTWSWCSDTESENRRQKMILLWETLPSNQAAPDSSRTQSSRPLKEVHLRASHTNFNARIQQRAGGQMDKSIFLRGLGFWFLSPCPSFCITHVHHSLLVSWNHPIKADLCTSTKV